MQIYLPIAEMSVPAETLVVLGAAVGFLSGLFGVGGGFLATPFLLFMGIPPSVAVGTQANQLVATSMTGVLGHWRRGNVDFHMGFIMLIGGMIGSVLGSFIFGLLQHFGQIDVFIAFSYILLLGTIGGMMLFEGLASFFNRNKITPDVESLSQKPFFRNLPYKMRFQKSRLYISAFLPIGIGILGGLLVTVMGIGGGFILVPAMIYILGMPAILVAGTSLFQIIFVSAFACILHAMTSHTVDIILSMTMTVGGVMGAQLGVILSRRIKGASARIFLALLILAVCLRMMGVLFIQPSDMFSLDVRR